MRNAGLCFVALVALVACSSTTNVYPNGSPDSGAETEGGGVDPLEGGHGSDAGSDAGTSSPGTNPYGRAYPTANIGWNVRKGSTGPGSVIANLSFEGFKIGSNTSERISLAYVYDPDGRTHDIVALLMVDAWDVYSKQLMTKLSANGRPSRVAMISVLGEGSKIDTAATLDDLTAWRPQLDGTIHVRDPKFAALDPLAKLEASAVPRIVILDARTMEIVSADLGVPPDPGATIEAARDATKARPPSY